MEAFEIKELFAIHGYSGLFKFMARLRNNSVVMVRLIDQTQKVIVPSKDMGKLSKIGNIGIYVTDQDDPITLESVIDKIYAMADSGIDIPKDSAVIGDRWATIEDFMEEVVPNHDRTRFKPYHMDKILKWYNEFVQALDMLDAALDAEDDALAGEKIDE